MCPWLIQGHKPGVQADFITLYCHKVDITNENSRRTRFNFHQYCRSNILETTKQSGLIYKSSFPWIPLMLSSLMVSSCAISILIILNAAIWRWLRFKCNVSLPKNDVSCNTLFLRRTTSSSVLVSHIRKKSSMFILATYAITSLTHS